MSSKAAIQIRIVLVFSFFSMSMIIRGQDSIENAMISLQEIMTEIASRSEGETNMDELADALNDLIENPIHVNYATDEDWSKLFWLTEFQIQNIKKYIILNGVLTTVYEIVYIEGFSEKDAKMLSPFLLFDVPTNSEKPLSSENVLHHGKHRIILRSQRVLEMQKGFITEGQGSSSFKGNPMSAYMRYSYQRGNKVLVGFTADKDAGEEFFSGSNKAGFDFYSGYLQINNTRRIKTLILGDYRVYFGQGLAVWSGFNFGKSSVVMSTMQRNQGIVRYQSSDENNFFRGSALTLEFKPVEITFWASRHGMDANITARDSINNNVLEVSSVQTSGLHTTASEINDEKSIQANVLGGHVSFIKQNFRSGLTAVYYNYSSPLMAQVKPYNDYFFKGTSNYNLSCDFRYRTGHVIFFGEEAISQNGGVALLNGTQTYICSRLNFMALHRFYQRNYQTMYGNAFGENSRNNNEEGLFAGLECRPFKYITLSGYIDVFRFPWLTYNADMPSSGRDFLAQIDIDPNSSVQMYLQYRNKVKDNNYSHDGDAKNTIIRIRQQRVRCNLSYAASENITLRSRVELSYYRNEISGSKKGIYLGQDLEFGLSKLPIRFYLRYAVFDTEDYNTRIYAYENDLLYAFSIPAFYDKGCRAYVMLKCSPTPCIDVWIKYGTTQYSNRETVGTGLYEIDGNRKSEVKVQMLVKL